MAYSIGIDIVDIADFKKRIKRTKYLKNRLFTKYELDYCGKKDIGSLGSRFAAKESFAKASSIKNLSWHDVEVRNDRYGRPYLRINKKIMRKYKIKSIDVSISNTKKFAAAAVTVRR